MPRAVNQVYRCQLPMAQNASARNRAQVTSMATMYSTTRPLMLSTWRLCLRRLSSPRSHLSDHAEQILGSVELGETSLGQKTVSGKLLSHPYELPSTAEPPSPPTRARLDRTLAHLVALSLSYLDGSMGHPEWLCVRPAIEMRRHCVALQVVAGWNWIGSRYVWAGMWMAG